MTTRPNQRRYAPGKKPSSFQFESLEPRNLLTTVPGIAQWGIADPYSSDLLTQFQAEVPVVQQVDVLRSHLNADQADSFQLISQEQDDLGFEHFKYQHERNGIPVESSVYTVHAKDGLIVSLSGEYHSLSSTEAQPRLSQQQALNQALDFVDADNYIWQNENFKELIGGHDHGLDTELPEGDLVYSSGQLAYKFDIYAMQPHSRSLVFVDASDGKIIDFQEMFHGFDVPASGPTLYDLNKSFTAEFTGAEYRLREVGNASEPAIQTFTLNQSEDYADAVDFISNTASFNDPGHDLGNQTHWGTEQTWDYFFTEHGRDSYDDAGATLISYVSFGQDYSNAFWNGTFMTYGDGNGTTRGPLVSLDIIGHELAHGVTQFSAGLIYRNHSGALNESFSDIFGESVENHARGTNDWLMGGDIGLNGNPGQFRSMADPNLYNDPDTYLGDYWFSGNGDQGGVHVNSGVQNKWFYIMTNGEAGTNDTGHTYNVTAVGMQDAADIAYRNLTTYLTPNSTYPDARVGAIRSAIDLFGVGSQQHLSTMEAWDAVGVYDLNEEITLYPVLPLGSQVFQGEVMGDVEFETDAANLQLALDANQNLTLAITNVSGSLLPAVTITDSLGTVIASQTATATGDTLLFDNIPILDADIYTISVAGDVASTGIFQAKVLLNASHDIELLEIGTNDTLLTAQEIDSSALTQGHIPNSIVDRLAVLGELAAAGAVASGGDDFETGSLDSEVWQTFSSGTNGRIEVANDTNTPNGIYALSMDVDAPGFNLNEAILTIDLATATEVELTFSQASFGDETHILPATFTGSFNGDGVAISDDGVIWHTVWTNVSTPNGLWVDYVVDLDQAVADAGIEFGEDFQIKFQQYDDFPRISDGRAFDNIGFGETSAADWYSLTVQPGESITAVATQIQQSTTPLLVELFDATETLLLTSVNALNTLDAYIQSFISTATEDEIYYLRVSGETEMYSLVVTTGGTFDLEQDFVQDITGLEGVLGHVAGSLPSYAEPDDVPSGSEISAAFTDVTLSDDVTGGGIYAITSGFTAPTGLNVFAPTPEGNSGDDDGFRDGVNEFRADFANLQSFVSIDVGSDDTLDVAFLRAYDDADNLLEEVIGAGVPINDSETLVINRPSADIAYVIAAGVGSHTAPLDNLVYLNPVTDGDAFLTTASVGDEIEFRAYLPGGGPFEFVNRLSEINGNQLQMYLVDPNGDTVDTAGPNEIIAHRAALEGDYQLFVIANAFDGEYYITRDTGVVSVGGLASKFLDGVPTAGTLADSNVSNDAFWQIDPSPTTNPAKQVVDLLLISQASVFSPTIFGFRLEATMVGGPQGDVIQQIELWNESAGTWEILDTRVASDSEIRTDVYASGDPARFVHPLTGEILARVQYFSPGFSGTPFAWTVDVDQAAFRVGEY